MNKINIVSMILYALAIVSFLGYLITQKSFYMASGGVLMIGGAIFMIIAKKEK